MIPQVKNKWFVIPKPNPSADIKLVCFPYAGGNASIYTTWEKNLPKNVELIIIQPPGRSNRISEAPIEDMISIVQEIASALSTILDTPYILFGHSLGSKIGFEVLRQLALCNTRAPSYFIASGSAGPQKKRNVPTTYNLNDDEFIARLEVIDGTPKEILQNREIMSIVLPSLKADFKISETYQFKGNENFNIPLSVFGGENDSNIPIEDLNLWTHFFNNTSEVHVFPGGHFFINSHKEEVLKKINEIIKSCLENSGE